MLRSEWKFSYTGAQLAEGAQTKFIFHQERITWWKKHKEELIAQIKSEGIQVAEGAGLGYSNPKARDYERGAKVMVRNDLQEKLDECMEKLGHHTGKLRDYDGWLQVLNGNSSTLLEADMDDWLFYFGKN
jgi:hypothetical protein